MTVIGSVVDGSDHHSGYSFIAADSSLEVKAHRQMIVYRSIEIAAGATLTLVGDLVVIF